MASRPLPAFLFVAACLLLSGMVMRRQIAAHPCPPMEQRSDPSQGFPSQGFPSQGGFPPLFPPSFPPALTGLPVDVGSWHVLKGREREGVVMPIREQLVALENGDEKAARYQRRGPFRFTPMEFMERVEAQSNVFARSRSARFGTVWADRDGQHADVRVVVQGDGGQKGEGLYEMVRQDGVYRVAGFRGGGWMPK